MTSRERRLKLLDGELTILIKDLGITPILVAKGCPETISTGLFGKNPDGTVSVPAADFLRYFLATYLEWNLLRRRMLSICEESFRTARARDHIEGNCRAYADKIARNEHVQIKLSDSLKEEFKALAVARFDSDIVTSYPPTVDSIFHTAVELEQTGRLCEYFAESMPDFCREAREITSSKTNLLRDAMGLLDPALRVELDADFRARRSSMMGHFQAFDDLQFNVIKKKNYYSMEKLIAEILNDPSLGDSLVDASPVIKSILGAIENVGYDNLLEDILDGLLGEGTFPEAGEGGRTSFNIIPGRGAGHAACHPVLLALSKGDRGKFGFDAILQRVRTHLVKCRGITRTVIFFSTNWDSAKFAESHYPELQAIHSADGVRFVFLIAGTPPTTVTRAPVSFL